MKVPQKTKTRATIGEGNGNPLQGSCLENRRDSGACFAAVYGVAQSRTWLNWLNSSSSNRATIWSISSTPGLGIYPKKMKTLIWKDTCTPIFRAALFSVAKIRKQLKWPWTDEWIKMWHVDIYTRTHTHTYIMEYYSAIKKNEFLPFVPMWIDLKNITLSKISQRKTNTLWCHLHVKSKK